jgi:hypothetical protein
MERYFIQDYWTGLNILDNNRYYTRYFNTIKDAEEFINSLEDLNNEDGFYIVKELDGKIQPIEY